jgi:multicomponent Na+:H+ antiporter subunit D
VALITSVLTLASFVKVTQSVFFGQLPKEFEQVEEVPLSMRLPMWMLAVLCILTGLFPDGVRTYLLTPAVSAIANVPGYVDAAMGQGYAAAHGVMGGPIGAIPVTDTWTPTAWLALLFCVTCAVAIVAILGSPKDESKEYISENDGSAEAKYDSFFSGEQALYSQVGGSDLFWGFKHNWRKYFQVMHNWHSGIVNDYTLYGVAAIAFVLLVCAIGL